MQRNLKIEKSSKKDDFIVLLEFMWDEIKIVAEGQSLLQEKMDTGFKEVSGRIDSLENEMSLLKDEMQAGFKTLIAGSVEDGEKFATKADKKDLILLEKRVEKLETAK